MIQNKKCKRPIIVLALVIELTIGIAGLLAGCDDSDIERFKDTPVYEDLLRLNLEIEK